MFTPLYYVNLYEVLKVISILLFNVFHEKITVIIWNYIFLLKIAISVYIRS